LNPEYKLPTPNPVLILLIAVIDWTYEVYKKYIRYKRYNKKEKIARERDRKKRWVVNKYKKILKKIVWQSGINIKN
jgi:hypothetical protein